MAARTRCPECGAMLAAGAEWCPQCAADLRAPVPADPAPADAAGWPDAADAAVALRARHRADGDDPPPGWPCPSCGTVNDLAADACRACGTGFLAPVSAASRVPVLPGFGSLSRGARLGATLLALVLLLTLMAGAVWLIS